MTLTVHNLISNGGFERGNLEEWDSLNTMITSFSPHTGHYSAMFLSGVTPAYLAQTVTIEPGEGFKLLVSLAKFGILQHPSINISVTFFDENNDEVGTGLNTVITNGTLPSALFNNWHEVYQITGAAPETATQAKVEISKADHQVYYSSVLIDDVNLLSFSGYSDPPGVTGPTEMGGF